MDADDLELEVVGTLDDAALDALAELIVTLAEEDAAK
jgi:hypothetical protein